MAGACSAAHHAIHELRKLQKMIDSLATGFASGPVSVRHAVVLEVVFANAQCQSQAQLFSRSCLDVKVADCHLRLLVQTLLFSGLFGSTGELSLNAPTST